MHVWNTFTAQVEPIAPSAEVRRVVFTLGELVKTDRTSGDGWSARFDMSDLPPGDLELEVVAFDEYDVISAEPWEGEVQIWDAAKGNLDVLLEQWDITWSEAQHKYTLKAIVPSALSPLWREDFELPFLGTLNNNLDAHVSITESFTISGTWTAEALFQMDAVLLDIDVLEMIGVEETRRPLRPVLYPREDERYHGRPNYYEVVAHTWTLYDGVVWAYPPWVILSLAIDFGLDGDLTVSGNLEAENGAPSVRLTAGLGAHVGFILDVDILLGVASGELEATPQFRAEFPLVLQASEPHLDVDNACVRFGISVEARIEVLWGLGDWSFGPWPIVDESLPRGCSTMVWPPLRSADLTPLTPLSDPERGGEIAPPEIGGLGGAGDAFDSPPPRITRGRDRRLRPRAGRLDRRPDADRGQARSRSDGELLGRRGLERAGSDHPQRSLGDRSPGRVPGSRPGARALDTE